MPTTYVTKRYTETGTARHMLSGTVQAFNPNRAYSINIREVQIPATLKRVRPEKLDWSTHTARTVTIINRSPGTVTFWNKVDYPFYLSYHNASPHFHVDFVNRNVPVPAIDWVPLHNRMHSKIRGEYVNLGMAAAEYRKTAELYTSISSDLVRITKGLLTRNPSLLFPRKEWTKAASKEHLRYIYGVSPFISELDLAMKALASPRPDPYIAGKLKGVFNHQFVRNIDSAQPVPYKATVTHTIKREMTMEYRAYLKTSVASTLSAYSLTNPAGLLWEMTPYSFVADWFVNVGDVLVSLDNALRYDRIEVIKSSKTTEKALFYPSNQGVTGAGTMTTITLNRNVREMASLYPVLRYQPHLSVSRLMAALSLTRVAFPPRPKNPLL